MADASRMPKPLKIGSLLRWRRADLYAWLAEGWRPPDDLPATAFVRKAFTPLAVDAQTAAGMFGVSVRHWRALHQSGLCPLPIRMGHSLRWRIDELRQWLAAGCPTCERWAEMQDADKRRSLCCVSRTRLVIRVMPRKNRRGARADVEARTRADKPGSGLVLAAIWEVIRSLALTAVKACLMGP
jgi:predicted DNA-binding transcriptional regulator AlpA